MNASSNPPFNWSSCLDSHLYPCSIGGGGFVILVLFVVVCILSCACLIRRRRRRRRRSRDISESTAGKSAQNDYKIENLTNDDNENYSNGSGATSGQGNYHIQDLSVRTPKSFGSSEDKQSSDAKFKPLDSIPEKAAETKFHTSSSQRGHRYDDVLPSDISNSIDPPSKTIEPYSQAMTHTLVLSNTDSRGSGKTGHTYHLLDGSSADEKATFVEATAVYSNPTKTGKDSSFLRGNLASGNAMFGGAYENTQSRRTTLSEIPSKAGVFDDPAYANTATTFTAAGKSESKKTSQGSENGPQRSSSLTDKTSKLSKKITRKPNSKVNSKATEQATAIVFDDPTYDVGLNLANT